MQVEISRDGALKKLDNFINAALPNYNFKRNFDLGPDDKSNVSCLSPYISHRLITEYEVAKIVLAKFPYQKVEKYIQEIFWRVYWKGWLELRPQVWSDFTEDLKALKEDDNYKKAINGETQIKCFNDWVNELKENNYLHNHTRMWFASIWIFTLELPWQLGAELFMQHLYDGDTASNTLGWRWVAGIQTQGKHYLASEWNIKKFTNNRFQNIKLNEDVPPKVSGKNYTVLHKTFENPSNFEEKDLLVFENNLSYEISDFANQKFKKILLIVNNNENRNIQLSENVLNFKAGLIEDQSKRLIEKSIDCKIIDIKEIKNLGSCYCLYPTIGENLDYINQNLLKNIEFLFRKIDQNSWKFCNKGFFNFKKYIPKIISSFS